MKLTVSSYMSPWESVDYSLKFDIYICGKWKGSTISAAEPIDLRTFAEQMANLGATSGEIVLDLSNIPNDVMTFEIRIIPHELGELAIVDVRILEVYERGGAISEESLRELVPIQKINAAGKSILIAAGD